MGCSIQEDGKESTSFKLQTEVWPSEDNGKIIPSQGNYDPFTIKTIYARPEPGWVFDRWEGVVNTTDNPTEISFYDNLAIRAVFKKDTFKVRTIAGGKGKGSELNQLYYPTGIALDPSGDLYVSDMYNHRIQSGNLVLQLELRLLVEMVLVMVLLNLKSLEKLILIVKETYTLQILEIIEYKNGNMEG
jgi:hypothetical protein